MQKFERTMDVVRRVAAAIERINSDGSLPAGVKIVPFYDRGDLVAVTVQTVLHNMFFGIALIFLIQWLFLGNLRCALDRLGDHPRSRSSWPSSSRAARRIRQSPVGRRHRSRHHRRFHRHHDGEHLPSPFGHAPQATADREAGLTDKLNRILGAAVEVDKAIFFSVIITIAAFLPLFTMQGGGRPDLRPHGAHLCLRASWGAVIATFTVTPVLVVDPAARQGQRGRNLRGPAHPRRL
jgi:cobalt-zinc-cadmium resistance protein CzcA